METYLDLSGGMHSDFDPIDQPNKTYRYLSNAIRNVSGTIETEKGTNLLYTFPSVFKRVVGYCVIDNSTVLFSYDEEDNISEIGILTENNSYTVLTQNSSLGFQRYININAEGRKNYKGEIIVYFTGEGLPMRVINLSNIPQTDFDDNTRLALTADMPQISSTRVVDGGSIPTGIYQFAVRLLTKSLNSTSLSILTNPLPILDESMNDESLFDGAPPQTTTNKAIEVNISNIDTDYEFVEVIAITYIGTGNVIKADIVARIPIQNRTSIQHVYSNVNQIKESFDIGAIGVEPVDYTSAKYIIQKDGVLIFAGLKSSTVEDNLQQYVNNISIKYVIREAVWNEQVNIVNGVDVGTKPSVGDDYKNPNTSQEFKSYMRDEVYSFGLVPIFKNWSTGPVYHIPGREDISAGYNPIMANTTTKELGTYYSLEEYPDNRGYPAFNNLFGKRVRHHRMPTQLQEPIIQARNGQTYMRMLGISVDLSAFVAAIPAPIKKQIIGYMVVRQSRADGNKSILSQGIATGHTLFNTTQYVPSPFNGKYPAYSYGPGQPSTVTDLNIVAFYSPESIISKDNLASATKIKPVSEINGKVTIAGFKTGAIPNRAVHAFMDFSESTGNTSLLSSTRNINFSYTQYITAGKEISNAEVTSSNYSYTSLSGLNKQIITWRNPGYLLLKLDGASNLPINNTQFSGKADLFYESTIGFQKTGELYINGVNTKTNPTNKVVTRHTYNLLTDLPRQYGPVFNAKYLYVAHKLAADSLTIDCFNGDTFITKFAVLSSMCISANDLNSIDLKTLSYFWVESGINCGYRHYEPAIGNEGDDNYEKGTLPYYPKIKLLSSPDITKSLGIFDYSTALGHPTGYNKQYSFENTIKPYFPKSIEIESVTDYPNRLIYSEQSVEGEQLDAYRLLLANNYHDIPKEKGKITNLFKLANTLYVHTERSLWKTYFNEQVTQASSAGEVYLGNGGIFPRPSTEVITVEGGYAGTLSSCGYTTPFGHFFIDNNQKKVFMFADQLKEISDQGMFKYFRANIGKEVDAPALGSGYISSYDYLNKRWLLSKVGQWTISYSVQLNSWSSFHSYKPYQLITNGDRLLSINQNKVYENGVGNYGVYYGENPSPMQLDIVINDLPHETKTFDNLVYYTTSVNSNKKEQFYDTFNTLHCYNDYKNTGKCRLIVPKNFEDEFINLGLFECFAKLKSNEFRTAIPSDLVIDTDGDIFDANNLDINRNYRPRMSGKWLIASLAYNNLRNNKFTLHNIGRLFRQRIR